VRTVAAWRDRTLGRQCLVVRFAADHIAFDATRERRADRATLPLRILAR
jgi:hypothetical protein